MSSHSIAITPDLPQNWNPGSRPVSPYDDDYTESHSHRSVPAPLHHRQEEGGGMYYPWRLFEERVRTGPYGLTSFPSQPYSPMRILILPSNNQGRVNPRLRQFISDTPPRIRNNWQLGLPLSSHEDPGLADSELKKAMKKLRKEAYNPTYPKKNEDNSCTICLEAFVPNEQVLVTTCNHMFHNDCLVPWLKSHGKCPVCRSVLFERRGRALSQNDNYNNHVMVSEDQSAVQLITLISAMEEALNWVNNSR